MCTHEFLEALVRLAITLYCQPGMQHKVSHAVSCFLTRLRSALPPEAFKGNSNTFSQVALLHIELTDTSLRRHASSLRALFSVYLRVNRNRSDDLQHRQFMSIRRVVIDAGAHGTGMVRQISVFAAKQIFKWSMIGKARPDHTIESERKMSQLAFEGQLRPCPLACTMALPAVWSSMQRERRMRTNSRELQDDGNGLDDFVREHIEPIGETGHSNTSADVWHI